MAYRLLAITAAVIVIVGVAAACGGGDDGEKTIQTQQGLGIGLSVLAAQQRAEAAPGGGSADAPAAPSQGRGAFPDLGAPGQAALFQESQTGLTVPGFGAATADADSAVLELYFSRGYAVPEPRNGGTSPGAEAQGAALQAPITESDLQPVIGAIVAAGVPREDIEFLGSPYYDPYSAGAILRATVRNIGIVGGVVQAAADGAGQLQDIVLQSTYVSYTVSDCAALERAALAAAIEDANERASAFAAALGVGLGEIVGASNYAWAPYGASPCDVGYAGPIPLGGVAYSESASSRVQVYGNVVITYAMR